MPLRAPKQNARTAKRQHECEQIFQKNKEEIRADLVDLTLAMPEIAKKWGIGDRMIRRWAERLGIDTRERMKNRNAQKGPTGIVNKKPPSDVSPQASEVWALWK